MFNLKLGHNTSLGMFSRFNSWVSAQ